MHPIFLSVLFLLPSGTAEVDCRSACQSCHVKEQPQALLDIYCAMCQECKERRKDRLKMKMKLIKKRTHLLHSPVTESTLQMLNPNEIYNEPPPQSEEFLDGDIGLAELMTTEAIPEGCPTSPPCSDDEAPPPPPTSTTSTTTTTTTTKRPCPPITSCKKKTTSTPSPPPPLLLLPCQPPCMQPGPGLPPPPCCIPPQTCPPPPMFSVQHYMPVVPSCNPPPSLPALKGLSPDEPSTRPVFSDRETRKDADYHYLYVGLPKNVMKNIK